MSNLNSFQKENGKIIISINKVFSSLKQVRFPLNNDNIYTKKNVKGNYYHKEEAKNNYVGQKTFIKNENEKNKEIQKYHKYKKDIQGKNEYIYNNEINKETGLKKSFNDKINCFGEKNNSKLISANQIKNSKSQIKTNNNNISFFASKIVKPQNMDNLLLMKKKIINNLEDDKRKQILGLVRLNNEERNTQKSFYGKNNNNNLQQKSIIDKKKIFNGKEEGIKNKLDKKRYDVKSEIKHDKLLAFTRIRKKEKELVNEEAKNDYKREDIFKKLDEKNQINDLKQEIIELEKEIKLQNENISSFKKETNEKNYLLILENEKLDKLIKENEEKYKESLFKIKSKEKEIIELKRKDKDNQILLKEEENKINNLENIIKDNNNKILSLEENEKLLKILLGEKDNKINKFNAIIEDNNNKIFALEKKEKESQFLLNEKDNKINELENRLKDYNNKIILLEEKAKQNKIFSNKKDNKINELENLIKEINNKMLLQEDKEKKFICKIQELEDIIKNNNDKMKSLFEKEKKSQFLLNEKELKIKELENTIKMNNIEISSLKKKNYEISENYQNEINKYKEKINKMIINENQNLSSNKEKKVLEYNKSKIEKEEKSNGNIDIKNEELLNKHNNPNNKNKIYGFINSCNDCYLNSSLQLLTRIKELKNGIYNYEKKFKINEDNDTKGQLFIEFKKLLNIIDNSKDGKLIINPKPIKNIMGKIDDKYYENNQEDANEFISNFIDGLLMETSNKLNTKELNEIKTLKINDILVKNAYDNFFKRFYIKRGYSFLIDIFYGILQMKKTCKNCGEKVITFNPYNMIELPIYQIAKKDNNKILFLTEILDEFIKEKKQKIKCNKCGGDQNVYIKTSLYKLSKYLLLFFGRTFNEEYLYNNILYDEDLMLKSDYDNVNHKYKLECVIEHSGGLHYGHYSSLCPINNVWFRFSDSFSDNYDINFQSKNAIILLYKIIP